MHTPHTLIAESNSCCQVVIKLYIDVAINIIPYPVSITQGNVLLLNIAQMTLCESQRTILPCPIEAIKLASQPKVCHHT